MKIQELSQEQLDVWHEKCLMEALAFTTVAELPTTDGNKKMILNFDKSLFLVKNFTANLISHQSIILGDSFREYLVKLMGLIQAVNDFPEKAELITSIKLKIGFINGIINTANDNLVFLQEQAEKRIKAK